MSIHPESAPFESGGRQTTVNWRAQGADSCLTQGFDVLVAWLLFLYSFVWQRSALHTARPCVRRCANRFAKEHIVCPECSVPCGPNAVFEDLEALSQA